ncbi:MAG TPA: GNAT family N-acetyltransferase [Chloroflexi bacterium]|nr:GNAT family N-acetyltransferase [Chloroflexota bacterium]
MKVRFAGLKDLEWCIREDSDVDPEVLRWKVEHQEIIIAEVDGQPVGYLRLEYLWSQVPYIGLIWVLPGYRRRGIGRAMLRFLEEFLRSKGHRVLYSSSQANEPEPQAWHRHVGFQECGFIAGINEGGVGEVFFHKSLTNQS